MPRHRYGSVADYVISVGTNNTATLQPGAAVTVWNAAVGGTQYTDLTDTDGTTPIASGTLTADSNGAIPEFYGPDGISSLYFDANGGSGPRRRVVATDLGDGLNSVQNDLSQHISNADATYLRKNLGVFQVEGLVGDGTTDDAPTIQAVLDAAHSAGGGIVVIPAGRTYALGTYLVPRSGVTIMAYGATFKATSVGLLRNFTLSDSFPGYTGEGNIAILGGVWDANASDGAGGGAVTGLVNAFTIGHAQHVTIRDVTIRNVSSAHGIEINASSDVKVTNCRFEGFKDNTADSSRAYSEAIQLDYAITNSGSVGPDDNTAPKNILVEGCSFGASDRLPGFGRAVGSHTSVNASTWIENVQIIGNRIEATAQEGFRAYGWRNAVIADNVIAGTGMADIMVTGPDPAAVGFNLTCQNIVVQGNVVTGPSANTSAIRVIGFSGATPSGVVIDGNLCTGGTSTAIYVSLADRPSITNNRAMQPGSSGIYSINCTTPHISGNSTVGSGNTAIGVDTCTGGIVEGNSVHGTTAGHGILVSAGSDVSVIANRVNAASSSGIRVTGSTARARVMSNTVLRGGVSALGVDLTASATGCIVVGNDLTGSSWPAGTALSIVNTGTVVDWSGGTTTPGHNLVS